MNIQKRLFPFIACLLLILNACEQAKEFKDPNAVYNKTFNWTIKIPENFEKLSSEEWFQVQNKGNEIDSSKIKNNTLFVFRSGDLNYLESNHQAYDFEKDGDYIASCKKLNVAMYESFEAQMPGIKIDSLSSVEVIDELNFQAFHINMSFPNGITLKSNMYTRLFDDQEFSVNIMYVDETEGEKMLNAWKSSNFETEKPKLYLTQLISSQLINTFL